MIRYLPLIEFKSPAWGNAEAFALGSDDLARGFFPRLVNRESASAVHVKVQVLHGMRT